MSRSKERARRDERLGRLTNRGRVLMGWFSEAIIPTVHFPLSIERRSAIAPQRS